MNNYSKTTTETYCYKVKETTYQLKNIESNHIKINLDTNIYYIITDITDSESIKELARQKYNDEMKNEWLYSGYDRLSNYSANIIPYYSPNSPVYEQYEIISKQKLQ